MAKQLTQQFGDWVIVSVYDAFFERNNCVIGYFYFLGTDMSAALSDIAESNTFRLLKLLKSVFSIEWVHLQSGNVNQGAWADELIVQMMLTEYMADILTKETLDALTKFLNPVDVTLVHVPGTILVVRFARLELFNSLLNPIVPGNVCGQVLD